MSAKGHALGDAASPVVHDHETVNEYLAEMEALLIHHDQIASQICGTMKRLGEFLLSHMDAEERSELFRVLPQTTPWLYTCVQRLRDGHQSLRGQLEALADATNVHAPRLDCAEFRNRFQALAKELRDHEEAEVAIWQKAYNQDEGTKD